MYLAFDSRAEVLIVCPQRVAGLVAGPAVKAFRVALSFQPSPSCSQSFCVELLSALVRRVDLQGRSMVDTLVTRVTLIATE